MKSKANTQPSLTLDQMIAQARTATHLLRADRKKMHRGNIQSIMYRFGIDGVNRYKAALPEAKAILLNGGAIAFVPKPQGYDAYLVEMALRWLDSPTARNATNLADVERLNDKFGTSFPPTKHFSEALTKQRLGKIKEAYAERGIQLPASAKSMSAIRKVAKAATGAASAETRFSSVGVIAGDTLVINGRSLPIETNGTRRCIRPTINGKRSRLYLDELEWIADWFGGATGEPLQHTNTLSIIGELPYPAQPAEPAPVDEPEPSSLAHRIARLVENMKRLEPTPIPEGYDPLEFADIS